MIGFRIGTPKNRLPTADFVIHFIAGTHGKAQAASTFSASRGDCAADVEFSDAGDYSSWNRVTKASWSRAGGWGLTGGKARTEIIHAVT